MIRQVIYIGILVLCAGLMIFQLIRGRGRALTAILFRLTGGVVGILCANSILGILGLPAVGLNAFTLCIVGSLGLPGAILLYTLLNLQYM